MTFFNTYLRIKSRILKKINIKPKYQKFKITIDMIIDIQIVKQVIHEKSFKKNLNLKSWIKDLLINRYSI